MKIEILNQLELPLGDRLDCLDACFLALKNELQVPNYLFYCYNWMLYKKYDNQDVRDFQVKSLFYQAENVRSQLGVAIQANSNKLNGAWACIEKQLEENKILLLGIDAFYCPWNPAYNLGHIIHYLIPKKVIYEDEVIECYEPFHNPGYRRLPFKSLAEGYADSFIFERESLVRDIDLYHYCQTIVGGEENIKEHLQSYEELISFLCEVDKFEELFESSQAEISSITQLANRCCDSRYVNGIIMKGFFDSTNENQFEKWSNIFLTVSSMWKKIYLKLVKMFYTKRINSIIMQRIIDELRQCMFMEEQICIELMQGGDSNGTNVRGN